MERRTIPALVACLVLAACGGADEPPGMVGVDAGRGGVGGTAQTLVHDFPAFSVTPGEEHSSQCQSWTLDNDETLYVNTVEMTNGGSFHHSNWFYVPEDRYDGPDGTWQCADRSFDGAIAAGVGGVLFAQSTQVAEEAQRFPDRHALAIPTRSRIVGNVHILHAAPEPRETHIQLRLHTLAGADADVLLAPFSLTYFGLDLPPHQQSRFTVECDIRGEHLRRLDRLPDFRFYYVLPHYHYLGQMMRLEAVDAAGAARTVYDIETTVGEPLGSTLAPPVSVEGADSLRLTCGFDNPGDNRIRWGIGDQEMCIFLAYTDSPYTWGGGMLGTADDNREVTVTDGISMNEGPCVLVTAEAGR